MPFIADSAYDCRIYYIAKDMANNYQTTSAYKTIHIKPPKLLITMPADSAKFTYSLGSPGIDTIRALGTTKPRTTYEDSIVWTITPIKGSTLTYYPTSQKGRTMKFTYTNLPDSNRYFGYKYIKATLKKFNISESVLVEVFFPKNANNHPAGITPNWFYYWGQTVAHINRPQNFGGQSCYPGRKGYYDPESTYFHICNPAGFLTEIECNNNNIWDGIDSYAAAEIHESTHLIFWWQLWPNGYNPAADNDEPGQPFPGDYIPDSLEGLPPFEQFNPHMKDSDNDGNIDFDDLGYDAECLWGQGSANVYDWAYPGHQW